MSRVITRDEGGGKRRKKTRWKEKKRGTTVGDDAVDKNAVTFLAVSLAARREIALVETLTRAGLCWRRVNARARARAR